MSTKRKTPARHPAKLNNEREQFREALAYIYGEACAQNATISAIRDRAAAALKLGPYHARR